MTNLRDRVKSQTQTGGRQQQGDAPPKTAVDRKVLTVRTQFAQMRDEFDAALPRHLPVDRFLRMANTCVRKTPALLDCDMPSLLGAMLEAARVGLEPGTKQAAIVPFGKQATFIAQWQGLVELMYRSGEVGAVIADYIYEDESWEYSVGDGGTFRHRPDLLNRNNDRKILLAYAFAEMRGGARSKVIFLNRDEAEEIRDEFSKNYQRAERNRRDNPAEFEAKPWMGRYSSTWHTHFDPMWRKSCVRRLADWVPNSPELRYLMSREDEAGEMPPSERVIPGSVIDIEAGQATAEQDPDADAAAEAGVAWDEPRKPGSGLPENGGV